MAKKSVLELSKKERKERERGRDRKREKERDRRNNSYKKISDCVLATVKCGKTYFACLTASILFWSF